MGQKNSIEFFKRVKFSLLFGLFFCFGIAGCDQIIWYKNASLPYQNKTHFHTLDLTAGKFNVRIFQARDQLIVEVLPIVITGKPLITSNDLTVSADGLALSFHGFLDNYSESDLRKYKSEQLSNAAGIMKVGQNFIFVYESTKSTSLDLKFFEAVFKMEKD